MSNDSGISTTQHRFGGSWTVDKLQALRDYLGFYAQALKAQPFQLVYIDSFAGSGRCQVRLEGGAEAVIDGSAKIALDCPVGFQSYHFIEAKARHADELASLIAAHPNGHRATLERARAADALPRLLALHDWRKTRGVLFLDPYGLQCTWDMVQRVAATKALDVFFLVSVSGLFRQAAINERRIDGKKSAALTRFLGTAAWQRALYTQEQPDLFEDAPQRTREPGYESLLRFTAERLKSVFPHVGEPLLLRRKNGPVLFALFFAVSNPSSAAVALASRVSNEILSKLR